MLNWPVCKCEQSRFSCLVIASLAAFGHLFQDGLDGGVLVVVFVLFSFLFFFVLACLSSGPAATIAD